MDDRELGKLAYDSYCGSEGINWKSAISGAPLPQFENTLEVVQNGWIACAKAIKEQCL